MAISLEMSGTFGPRFPQRSIIIDTLSSTLVAAVYWTREIRTWSPSPAIPEHFSQQIAQVFRPQSLLIATFHLPCLDRRFAVNFASQAFFALLWIAQVRRQLCSPSVFRIALDCSG